MDIMVSLSLSNLLMIVVILALVALLAGVLIGVAMARPRYDR
jgi:uncharacterized protein YneF (UPF0154 family)